MTTEETAASRAHVHGIVRQHRILVAAKTCDGCGHDSVIVTLPIERGSQEIKTGDDCHCPECDLTGTVVLHGVTPSSDDIEDTFDVAWIDPETGGDYRVSGNAVAAIDFDFRNKVNGNSRSPHCYPSGCAMASCEKCWRDAKGDPERYRELIEDRTGTISECTPEEIAGGEDAGLCVHCDRFTVHCVVGRCMNPRCAKYDVDG